ncbi:PLP-dependent aminotransferase family protein [Pararobbsia silviterrae]|uniref:PLP-dependent aminotransferase family protein n=1 Tax=Pararobbsia silviterrae TaxID=1792498 RepID=A0A494Y441_9BURK|nr:PLP-dependent aminotransferase family protein [Pararobbsia silviterrae]RKP57528.1 PLP-dependent aminotransferase family protein [Pararobbsia silviterrae]
MKLELDASLGIPLTDQIVNGVRTWLRTPEARVGSKLPSIRQLAAQHGISRFPVIEAYDRLVSLGLVDSRQGSGFYVADRRAHAASLAIVSPELVEEVSGPAWQAVQHGPGMLRLGSGWTPEDWRDMEGLSFAIRQLARMDPRSLIDYSTPLGNATLREQVALRLAVLGIHVHPHRIMLTQGASQALDLVIRWMLKPGDTVFVEDPGYYNLLGLLRISDVQIVGIPRTRHGPDIEVLEAKLREYRPKLFFVNTVFHNPTGTTMSPPNAFRVLQLAKQHAFKIVEDDVFADFQVEPTDRLATLDQLESVIYIGGFSKTLSSSLRVGYLVADPEAIRMMADIKTLTSITSSRFAESIVSSMLERGAYRKYLDRLRRQLGEAQARALQTLDQAGWEVFGPPVGGHFLWARVPHVADSRTLSKFAERFGIAIPPGHAFHSDLRATPWLRINVAYANETRAVEFLHEAAAAAELRIA